ncbi:hypothetical protein CJP74_06875 [Psittacicella melopsittaci]|uniref:DUF2059 domain-containing protein n=1 Tax=Psittacicella melopsittaci TaxID=2028576 RepID=A0A3A1Y2U8_9GAMM|nr:hypothetical protein [Psittacicella melopsittaci]RIY31609.1 hypothetical protein CJP74_06875 [Psittacicella melopsittaci]
MAKKLISLALLLGLSCSSQAVTLVTQNKVIAQIGTDFLSSPEYIQAMQGDKTRYLKANFDLTREVARFYLKDPSLKGNFPASPFMDNLYNYGFYFMQNRIREASVEQNLSSNIPMALEATNLIIYLSYVAKENALAGANPDGQVVVVRAYRNFQNFNLPTFMAQYIAFCNTPQARIDREKLPQVYKQVARKELTAEQAQELDKYAQNFNVFMQTSCDQFVQFATVFTTPGAVEFNQALSAFVYTDKSLATQVQDYQKIMYGQPDALYKGVDFNNANAQTFSQAYLSNGVNTPASLETHKQAYINFIANLKDNPLVKLAFSADIKVGNN